MYVLVAEQRRVFFNPPDGKLSFICADEWGLFTAADAILLYSKEPLTQSTQNALL